MTRRAKLSLVQQIFSDLSTDKHDKPLVLQDTIARNTTVRFSCMIKVYLALQVVNLACTRQLFVDRQRVCLLWWVVMASRPARYNAPSAEQRDWTLPTELQVKMLPFVGRDVARVWLPYRPRAKGQLLQHSAYWVSHGGHHAPTGRLGAGRRFRLKAIMATHSDNNRCSSLSSHCRWHVRRLAIVVRQRPLATTTRCTFV